MNSLWPAASRFSCANPRTFFQTCQKFDSLATRLARRSVRPYSIASLPFRRRDEYSITRKSLGGAVNRSWSVGIGAARTFASKRIITRWELLPDDYEDREGIPFRSELLTKKETLEIFGKGIDASTANRLLSILHGRRVAGTLADPDAPNYLGMHEKRAQRIAIEWLRKNVPVDEVRSAGLHAERELAEVEEEVLKDSERLGLYKPGSKSKGKQGAMSKNVYGKSGLDYIREQKERELDEREKREKATLTQAEEIEQNTGTLEPMTVKSRVELRRPGENPWLKYYIERSKILPNTPPEMTIFQRLWPSGLLTLAILGFCLVLPLIYTPPKNSQRMFPDLPPAAATVLGIIAINFLVFAAWRSPPFFRVLNKYFMTVPGYPIAGSLLGNIFSHQQFSHLAANMIVLFLVGSRLHDEVGRANFLAIYIGSGMFGSFVSLSSWVLRASFVSSTLGASGAICGVIGAYFWLNRNEVLMPFGTDIPFLQIKGWIMLAVLFGSDAFVLSRWGPKKIKFDNWAHLGGSTAGVLGAELVRRRVERRRKVASERGLVVDSGRS